MNFSNANHYNISYFNGSDVQSNSFTQNKFSNETDCRLMAEPVFAILAEAWNFGWPMKIVSESLFCIPRRHDNYFLRRIWKLASILRHMKFISWNFRL